MLNVVSWICLRCNNGFGVMPFTSDIWILRQARTVGINHLGSKRFDHNILNIDSDFDNKHASTKMHQTVMAISSFNRQAGIQKESANPSLEKTSNQHLISAFSSFTSRRLIMFQNVWNPISNREATEKQVRWRTSSTCHTARCSRSSGYGPSSVALPAVPRGRWRQLRH